MQNFPILINSLLVGTKIKLSKRANSKVYTTDSITRNRIGVLKIRLYDTHNNPKYVSYYATGYIVNE